MKGKLVTVPFLPVKKCATIVANGTYGGKATTQVLRGQFSSITVADVICPTCEGPGIHIYPRMKKNTMWPVICYWCGTTEYEFTDKKIWPVLERDSEWVEGMVQTLIMNMNPEVDLFEILEKNEREGNYYDI